MSPTNKNKVPVIQPANDADETGPIDVLTLPQDDPVGEEDASGIDDGFAGGVFADDVLADDEIDRPAEVENNKLKGLSRLLIALSALVVLTITSWYLLPNIADWGGEQLNQNGGYGSSYEEAAFDLSDIPEENLAEAIQLQEEIAELQEKRRQLLQQETQLQRQLEELQKEIQAGGSI